MASPSKAKGNGFEREIVHALEAAGIPARRAWGSNGQSLGTASDVDILAKTPRGEVALQCKRRAKTPAYLHVPPPCKAVIFRQDHDVPLVLLPLPEYLLLLQR